MSAPSPGVWLGGLFPRGDPGAIDVSGSVGGFCESPGGGSGSLDEGAFSFAGTFPEPAGSEALGSDGGSPLSEAAELSDREAGLAEATTGGCVGLSFPGSPVLTGEGAGSLGRGAGLAISVEGEAFSGTVVGSAGAGAGVGVGLGFGVGRSKAAGVNAIGGSKSNKVLASQTSLQKPVHFDAHCESRANISMGGRMTGSHGGPMVVTMLLADVLIPRPQVGHSRSRMLSGLISPGFNPFSVGSFQISPTVKLSPK